MNEEHSRTRREKKSAVAGQPSLFNPERPQALVQRYNKYLVDGTLSEIRVVYRAGETSVTARRAGTMNADGDLHPFQPVGVALKEARVATPVDPEGMNGLRMRARFERRFCMEAPEGLSAEFTAEQAYEFVHKHFPFVYRRAMDLSNKQFDITFPGGFLDGVPVVDSDSIREPFLDSFRGQMVTYYSGHPAQIPVELKAHDLLAGIPQAIEDNDEVVAGYGTVPITPAREQDRARIARRLFAQ